MAKEVLAFGWAEFVDEVADPAAQAFDGALGVLAQMRLELGESLFDRIEVG